MKKAGKSKDSGYPANAYEILNFLSVGDCGTLDELKNKTGRILERLKNEGKNSL